jgi:hypothetical protein
MFSNISLAYKVGQAYLIIYKIMNVLLYQRKHADPIFKIY